MKIAIVGSGIAGNVVAYHLQREHDVTVFEAASHIGGHTHTHDVIVGERRFAVDTGFIVFNDWTYPNFIELLGQLGVEHQESSMSFSLRCQQHDLEYNGTSLDGLFAQRRNLVRPAFWRMLRDIVRCNREAPTLLGGDGADIGLGDYLSRHGYSREFRDWYIVPMGAAIWSTDPAQMLAFPAHYFVRFLHNHGMLSVNDRPMWRTIRGGSRAYVRKLTAAFADRIRLNSPVVSLRRYPTHVMLQAAGAEAERFDAAFLACHSDQALRLLETPNRLEREALGAIPYQRNDVVLHTDTRLLPRRPRAWAAWNYALRPQARAGASVTYNMNILQRLDAPVTFCVTLNNSDAVDPAKIIQRLTYDHPLYTRAGVAAQALHETVNGVERTYYCGAYWRFGFHEDGVVSALAALDHFRARFGHVQLPLRRLG